MTCVYTGARVFFENYGMIVSADLHKIGDTIVVNWEVQSIVYLSYPHDEVTHKILDLKGCYHNDKKGITVVPGFRILGEIVR